MTTISSTHNQRAGLRLFDDSMPSELSSAAQTLHARVLLVSEGQAATDYAEALRSAGCELVVISSLQNEEQASAHEKPFDIVILDCRVVGCATLLASAAGQFAAAQLITIADGNESQQFLSADRSIFVSLPLQTTCEMLLETVRNEADYAITLAENHRLRRQLALRGTRELVGHSACMQQLRQRIVDVAASNERLLILGESGTGKQVAARAIHDCGSNAQRPFVTVDCSVFTAAHLQRELLGESSDSSQLGGREQVGRLSAAAGGTLVLQHIDDLSLMLQAELMRILRDGKYRMLGSDDDLTLTTRIVCTTRTDLHSLAEAGLFRADLLEEISQQTLQTPPLRERRKDMTALTEHFLREAAMKTGTIPKRIPIETMEVLCDYDWPENVRELESLITRACALDSGVKLSAETVRPWLLSGTDNRSTNGSEGGEDMSLREMEQMLIESTFARYAGNRERTAQALEIGLRTLSGKLRDYGYPPRGGPESKKQKRAA